MARTQNSIRNVLSAMVGQLGGILVNLLARVFFLHYLNQTYLGLNGLFTNVLTMLSLVELGVGPAMAYSLYKPLADHDIEKLKSHMHFYKKAYITIGLAIAALGLLFLALLHGVYGRGAGYSPPERHLPAVCGEHRGLLLLLL